METRQCGVVSQLSNVPGRMMQWKRNQTRSFPFTSILAQLAGVQNLMMIGQRKKGEVAKEVTGMRVFD